MATEKLSLRVEALGDMLSVLSRLTSETDTVLDVLGGSLGQLGALTAPIHSRATALTTAQRNVAAAKAEVDSLLDHLDAARRAAGPLQAGPAVDLPGFMAALEALERSVAYLRGHSRLAAVQSALGQAQGLFNAALETCHADFAGSLADVAAERAPSASWVTQHLGDDVTDEATRESLSLDLVGPDLLPKLQRMAAVMMDAGYGPVRDGYAADRERALVAALRGVGQDTPFLATLQSLAPDALERAITGWTRRVQALVVLSLSERRLACSLWVDPTGYQLFSLVVGRMLRQHAQSGRDILEARRVPEKLFAVLDMHRNLRGVVPALEVVLSRPPQPTTEGDPTAGSRAPTPFSERGDGDTTTAAAGEPPLSPECAALVREYQQLLGLVGRAAAALFGEYEDVVARDASRILPPDGTIHPLTAQVVGYVKRLMMFPDAADVLFGADGGASSSGGAAETDSPGAPVPVPPARRALSAAVARLLSRLLDNLESKARGYRGEPALSALFMMNNVHYVQWSVDGGPTETLLGREWLERHKDLVEDWGARYQDVTWGPLIALIKAEAPADVGRLKGHLKDVFSGFNAALERIYATQSGWTIPDVSLRDAVRRVIRSDLLPPYQDFLKRYADVQFTSTPAKYIKYAASDVEAIIDDDLFEAKVLPSSKLDLKQQKMAAFM